MSSIGTINQQAAQDLINHVFDWLLARDKQQKICENQQPDIAQPEPINKHAEEMNSSQRKPKNCKPRNKKGK